MRIASRAYLLLLLVISLTACNSASGPHAPPAPPPNELGQPSTPPSLSSPTQVGQVAETTEIAADTSSSRPVTFVTEDSLTLSGTLYGDGPIGIILSHMYPTDQTSWQPFAEMLATEGYLALTYDFRGYGSSEGEPTVADTPIDLRAAIDFMRAQGAEQLVLIGANMGGTTSIRVATEDSDIAGVAVISAPQTFLGLEISEGDLARLTMPTLWISSRNDPVTITMEAMYNTATGPDKTLWVYEGSGLHGTYIFDDANGPDLQERLLAFVAHATSAAQ